MSCALTLKKVTLFERVELRLTFLRVVNNFFYNVSVGLPFHCRGLLITEVGLHCKHVTHENQRHATFYGHQEPFYGLHFMYATQRFIRAMQRFMLAT